MIYIDDEMTTLYLFHLKALTIMLNSLNQERLQQEKGLQLGSGSGSKKLLHASWKTLCTLSTSCLALKMLEDK